MGSNVTLQGWSGNTSALVHVDSGGTLVIGSGSKISGNANSSGSGGGVFVSSSGAFIMSGGDISGNSAQYGGGVYVSGGTFTKSGGVIYGSNASGTLKNIANGDGYGQAVYVGGSLAKIRNGTAGTGVTLDSTKDGAAGGWETPIPNDYTLAQSLTWLNTNAAEGGSYTIVLSVDEIISPQMLSYKGKNVTITLKGDMWERSLSLNSNGALFTVENGVTLTLDNNITLQGRSGNTTPLMRVNSGGTLTMESGSKIRGNVNTASNGGGVAVNSNGAFVINGGTFIKQSGGTIYGSNASTELKNTATNGDSYGHAVYVSSTMKRNSTAGEGVTLNSSSSGSAGGWE
jgi:hypothetical protein